MTYGLYDNDCDILSFTLDGLFCEPASPFVILKRSGIL